MSAESMQGRKITRMEWVGLYVYTYSMLEFQITRDHLLITI